MKYGEFWLKFGSALRTKHLKLSPAQRVRRWAVENLEPQHAASTTRRIARSVQANPTRAVERFAKRRRNALKRSVATPSVGALPTETETPGAEPVRPDASRPANRRPFKLPAHTGALPAEYIRLDPWEAEHIFNLASRSTVGIVETGRLHGGSTFLLSCANSSVPIHSIDIAPKDDERLKGFMEKHGVGENVNLIVGDSQFGSYPEIEQIDVLFVDGDHRKEGCRADLDNWYPKLVPGGHVVLHDCYFGCQVQDAVIEFIADNEVELLIPPWVAATHWHAPAGSLAHFVKPPRGSETVRDAADSGGESLERAL